MVLQYSEVLLVEYVRLSTVFHVDVEFAFYMS